MNSRIENIKTSFGTLFFLANKMETLCDRYLSNYNLTTKQFFLSLLLIQADENEETLSLSEVSERMGTSRQNVKQLALKLEQRGFCKILSDKNDKRILRLSVTKKNKDFWKEIDSQNMNFLISLFQNITSAELKGLAEIQRKLLTDIEDRLNIEA